MPGTHGDWRSYSGRVTGTDDSPHSGCAPTQRLGKTLYNCGFKGLISFSARLPDYKILAVFTTRLFAGTDKLEFQHYEQGILRTVRIP
jgi:hypothetical protein